MGPKVSDVLLDRLAAWGVRRIYGYPGDGINGLTSALRRAGDRFEFIQARHEEAAAMMACAHAKFGGRLIVPHDVQELEAESRAKGHVARHASSDYTSPLVIPAGADLRRAADVLNAGRRLAMPPEGQARAVQIDIDGRLVGLRFATEVNLVGDSAATLRALLPQS